MKRGGLCFLAILAVPSMAHAQSPADQRLAEALFDEGRNLMTAGKFADACTKFQESQRLDPGGGTLLNLALCHEAEGKLATAQLELEAAKKQAQTDKRPDREKIATEHLAAVGPKIPKLTVRVLKEEPTLEVRVDGAVLPRPAWGVAVSTDPGRHVIEASAQWKVGFRIEGDVQPGETRVVDVPQLLTTREAYAVGKAKNGKEDDNAVDMNDTPIERSNPWFRVAQTTMIVGWVTVAVAGSVWIEATIHRRSSCVEDRDYCSQGGLDAASRERTSGVISLVGLGLAVGGTIATIALPRYKTVQPTAQGMAIRF